MRMVIKSISRGLVLILTMVQGLNANAACNAMVNGRPMSMDLCRIATRVYGYVTPGYYRMDGKGNWVKLDAPSAGSQGNLYHDAQGSSGAQRPGSDCRSGRHGPYVTYRRAYEVAGNLQQQGCRTQVNAVKWSVDSPEYYVDAW